MNTSSGSNTTDTQSTTRPNIKTQSDINFVITIIGEKIRKQSPYMFNLVEYLDYNMDYFFSFMSGFVIIIGSLICIRIVFLIQIKIVKPIITLTKFINRRENNKWSMSKLIESTGISKNMIITTPIN